MLIKGDEKIIVGYSIINKEGELTNVFDVPVELKGKQVSIAMYDKLGNIGYTKVISHFYGGGSIADNYDAFNRVYNKTIDNKVEAALSTPSVKVLSKRGYKPTNIEINENKVDIEWIK